MIASNRYFHYSSETTIGTIDRYATFEISQPSAWRVTAIRIALTNVASAAATYPWVRASKLPYVDLRSVLWGAQAAALAAGEGTAIVLFSTNVAAGDAGEASPSVPSLRFRVIPDLWHIGPASIRAGVWCPSASDFIIYDVDMWLEVHNPDNA